MSDAPYVTIIHGHVIDALRTLPAGSVHCVVTSPPYWALRAYGTEPKVWGGDPDCPHEWESCQHRQAARWAGKKNISDKQRSNRGTMQLLDDGGLTGHACRHCAAWRGELGSEPNIGKFIENMVCVFQEVRRVLRQDGICWVNIGDTYASEPNGKRAAAYAEDGSDNRTFRDKPFSSVGGVLKPKDRCLIPERLAIALQEDGWWIRDQVIWCLAQSTRVYARTQTGDGPTSIRDLVRLRPETVQLWNGEKWTQVRGWSRSQCSDGLELELRNGQRISCTPNHLWPTSRGVLRTDALRVGDVIPVCKLPEPDNCLRPSALPDELVGWFVGAYIANGHRSEDAIQVACHAVKHLDRYDRLKAVADAYGGTCTWNVTRGNAAVITMRGPVLQGLLDAYVVGATCYLKHLHPRAWKRSDRFLRAVLEGYLTDGHHDTGNRRWRLGFCDNEALAQDLRTLCARLGVSLRLRRAKHVCNGKVFPGYRGELRLEPSKHGNARADGEVVAIRKSRVNQYWDIGVEDAPNLFALASGVLTHNSKPNAMPGSALDRTTTAHELIWLITRKARYFYDGFPLRTPAKSPPQAQAKWPAQWESAPGSHGRIHRQGRMSQHYADAYGSNKGADANRYGEGYRKRSPALTHPAGANIRSVWRFPTQPYRDAHYATFPEELARRCILAGTSEHGACAQCGAPWERVLDRSVFVEDPTPKPAINGVGGAGQTHGFEGMPRAAVERTTAGWKPTCRCGTEEVVPCVVLDPFLGSGTTAAVALRHGRSAVGSELQPASVELALRRIGKECAPNLFRPAVVPEVRVLEAQTELDDPDLAMKYHAAWASATGRHGPPDPRPETRERMEQLRAMLRRHNEAMDAKCAGAL